MARNFFELPAAHIKLNKYLYNVSLRMASLHIALSVPDIEARVHALTYFIAEEKDYCARCGLESSTILLEADMLLTVMDRRVQILNNLSKMSQIYNDCEANPRFEQALAEIMLHLNDKPLPALMESYICLRYLFLSLKPNIALTTPSI